MSEIAQRVSCTPVFRNYTHDRSLLTTGAKATLRWVLFLYLALVLCPIRYCAPTNQGSQYIDNTWMFALNYAAAHHLAMGRDIVWTWGPLSYLLFPFDIGNNLARGLAFQAALWVLIVVILSDLFFGSTFQLRNLALFSILIGLSVVDYHQLVHPDDLLLPAALILLVHFRLRGGIVRYVAALAIMGLIPLMQLTGGFVVAGVLAGLVVDRLLSGERGARMEGALAAAVPSVVAIAGLRLALGSFAAIGGCIPDGPGTHAGLQRRNVLVGAADRTCRGARSDRPSASCSSAANAATTRESAVLRADTRAAGRIER